MARLIAVEDLAGPSVLGRGGHAMHVLQILEGLRRLGHDVLFVEFLESAPSAAALRSFGSLVGDWWDPSRAALLDARTGASHAGVSAAAVRRFAAGAAGLLSLAAHYRPDPWPLLETVRPRLLFEQDPGYTHLWAADGDREAIFGVHDLYFTVGANVGGPRSAIPACGLDWHPLWPPVVLDWWTPGRPIETDRFTTIGAWRDYGYLEFEGRVLGPKVEEFEAFLDLPAKAGEPLELVLAIEPDDPDRDRLLGHGWRLKDPAVVGTPARYRDYVCGSLGEFSCAKGGYVGTRSGWFSDRSACYLAAGRPVVLQGTGFEDVLPVGVGALAVGDVQEAADALVCVRGDYARHAVAARELAREHFDAERLLGDALELAGIPRRASV
ncbi:MAG: glycosyltransferase [Solirubrobacteraceae bacterium]